MKTVLLLRHAKSSWDQPHLLDRIRPLSPRGREAAPLVGAYMARNDLFPARVLCSTANRAMETWDLVSPFMEGTADVEFRDELYHASVETLIAILHGLPASEDSVLLVGHNPTFEESALALAIAGRGDSMEQLSRKYPTGALAVLEFRVNTWPEVKEGTGFLRDFVRPRTLRR